MHRHDTLRYWQLVNRDADADTDTGTWIMGTVHGGVLVQRQRYMGVLVQRQLVNRDRNTGTEMQSDANVNFGTSYPHSTYMALQYSSLD